MLSPRPDWTVDQLRRKDQNLFVPGTLVRVKEHKLTSITYDYIYTYAEPSDMGVAAGFQIHAGETAVIVSVYDLDDRWLMLLTSDGMISWTFELEGLEILL